MHLVCKVSPNARKSECTGWGRDVQGRRVLLIKLAAQPVEGKANEGLVRFLASKFGCPKNQIVILRGGTGRTKMLEVPDVAEVLLPEDAEVLPPEDSMKTRK